MTSTRRTTWAATALAAVAALAGLVVPEVYPSAAGAEAMLRGYDLVTLVVVVPGLASVLLVQPRRAGWTTGNLLEVSLLTYLVYTYAYYVLGTGFADLLLLHVAVLALSLAALVLAVARIRTSDVILAFDPRTRVRPAAVVLGLLAAALAGMWAYWSIDAATTGGVPPGSSLVETDTVVHLGVVLDLTLLVPLYAVAAVLLWRRAAWGLVLGVVALVAGLLHQVSYAVGLLAQYAADVPGAVAVDPVEPVIIALYLLGAVPLLLGLRRPTSAKVPVSALPTPREAPDAQPHDLRRRSHVDTR